MSEEPEAKRRRVAWKPTPKPTPETQQQRAAAKTSSQTAAPYHGEGEKPSLQADLNIVEFCESRSRELLAMSRMARGTHGTRCAQQKVPRHMRRRAASHNIRRLPRRLRPTAVREQVRQAGAVAKRPSRKHRRRPSNLLQEYTRRQGNKKWLETHIWHAKRFHMTQRWGWRLALRPNDKGARAAYRAAAKHCLLQDVSFMTCVEIRGDQASVAERLNRLTSRDVGLRFGAAVYKTGRREGGIVLYEADMYPSACIGPVQFLWRPQAVSDEELGEAVLWIWAHPAIVNSLLRNILLVLEISPTAHVDVNGNKQATSGNQATGNQGTESERKVDGEKTDDVKTSDPEDKNKATDAKKGEQSEPTKAASEGGGAGQEQKVAASQKKTSSKRVKGSAESVDEKKQKKKLKRTRDGQVKEESSEEPKEPGLERSDGVFRNERFRVEVLRGELCRFQLTGPLSQAVLSNTLQPADVTPNGTERPKAANEKTLSEVMKRKRNFDAIFSKIVDTVLKDKKDGDNALKPQSESKTTADGQKEEGKWWRSHFASPAALDRHVGQAAAWCALSGSLSPAELPPRCVLGLTVEDPRLQLPAKRGKTYPDVEDWNADEPDVDSWTQNACASYSPLWEQPIRSQVSRCKLSDQKMNEMRSKLLVPGSALDLGDEASRVPVLLIQNPGYQAAVPAGAGQQRRGAGTRPPSGGREGLGCGWDVVLPARWAMAFWVPLVYRGARVCGLQDAAVQSTAQGALPFPALYPDTAAGRRHQRDVTNTSVTKYERRPPSKRTNYLKYGVAAPFEPPWTQLVSNWRHLEKMADEAAAAEEDDFYVLRSKPVLRALNSLCSAGHQNLTPAEAKLVETVFREENYRNVLVPVQVDMASKGKPGPLSMICVPEEQDWKEILRKPDYGGPEEPKHKVPQCPVKGKTKKETRILKTRRDETLAEVGKDAVKNIRFGCARQVAGFVCAESAGFDLTSGKGTGVGFVTLPALKVLLTLRDKSAERSKKGTSVERVLVLVRNTTSLQYRCAFLTVFDSYVKLC